jgi:hypothetical protein
MIVPGTLRDGGWPGFVGGVSFYRRFGRPSNLSEGEAVWLVFAKVAGTSRLVLNDVPLGDVTGAGQFEVTGQLADRNMMELVVNATDDRCGIVGEVTLEIRAAPIAG